jgi:hypothetical protein
MFIMGGGGSKPSTQSKPSMPNPRAWVSLPSSSVSYNPSSSLGTITTYNVNKPIPLNYNKVSLNNFGPCENKTETCVEYGVSKKPCGEKCIKSQRTCRFIGERGPGRRARMQCTTQCVEKEPIMCEEETCLEYNYVCNNNKRKPISELNGMEIPQIHERIEKMKNIIASYEQNTKTVMENFEKTTKDKVHRCFGRDPSFKDWKKWGWNESGWRWDVVNASPYQSGAWPTGTNLDAEWKC